MSSILSNIDDTIFYGDSYCIKNKIFNKCHNNILKTATLIANIPKNAIIVNKRYIRCEKEKLKHCTISDLYNYFLLSVDEIQTICNDKNYVKEIEDKCYSYFTFDNSDTYHYNINLQNALCILNNDSICVWFNDQPIPICLTPKTFELSVKSQLLKLKINFTDNFYNDFENFCNKMYDKII